MGTVLLIGRAACFVMVWFVPISAFSLGNISETSVGLESDSD